MEKEEIKIADARVDHGTCLSWQKGDDYALCLICEQSCPYQAITAGDIDEPGAADGSGSGQLRPVVQQDRCVGCGTCELNCPTGPPSAIRIYRLDAPYAS
jgi:ferredoxin